MDFVNTVAWSDGAHISERFKTYDDLVAWSELAGVLPKADAQHLLEEAARCPAQADAALREALALRSSIRQLLSSAADGLATDAISLRAFNAALSRALMHLGVVPAVARYDWGWTGGRDDFTQMLWPVAWSAATLLTSHELELTHECAGDTCGRLFLDRSRNRTRRWCDMKGCGNRAKARRHYHRKRQRVRRGGSDAAAAGTPHN